MKKLGFSLIELLITLFIASILLVACFSSMRHLVIRNRTIAATDHIVSGLNFARSEAIKRNCNVLYRGSGNCHDCDGNWNQGQIVKVEHGEVLRVFSVVFVGDTLSWNSSLGKDDFLVFMPLGTTSQSGTFVYSAHDQKYNRSIVVNIMGRIRVEDNL